MIFELRRGFREIVNHKSKIVNFHDTGAIVSATGTR